MLMHGSNFAIEKIKGKNIMATITPLDKLFVNVSQNGSARFSGSITGVTSFSDIIHYLREHLPGIKGMATFSVRNSTAGWSASRSVLFVN